MARDNFFGIKIFAEILFLASVIMLIGGLFQWKLELILSSILTMGISIFMFFKTGIIVIKKKVKKNEKNRN